MGCTGISSSCSTIRSRGSRRATERERLDGIGVDAWGVDYALLDACSTASSGLPFHYRDGRTDGMIAAAHAKVGREALYARTGIQTMPINTIFQLMSEADSPAARAAARLAFVPDLFGLWMTGELVNEATIASTSGLLGAEDGRWARDLIAQLGLPQAPFAHDPVEPGTAIGPLLARPDEACGDAGGDGVDGRRTRHGQRIRGRPAQGTARRGPLVRNLVAARHRDQTGRSSTRRALDYNLTNERGVGGRIRLLRNVMGLWLLQECRRAWERSGCDRRLRAAMALAEAADAKRARCSIPTTRRCWRRGDMPARLREACRAGGAVSAQRARRDRPVDPHFAGLQVPVRARAPAARHRADIRGSCTSSAAERATDCCASSRPTSPDCPFSPGRSRRRRSGTCSSRPSPRERLPT